MGFVGSKLFRTVVRQIRGHLTFWLSGRGSILQQNSADLFVYIE